MRKCTERQIDPFACLGTDLQAREVTDVDKYRLDGHKLYWHLDRVVEWQQKGMAVPIYVEVSPVGYCNHHCIFCGIDFARDNSGRLDLGVFCERVREMGALGVRSIMFAGEGEPLLRGDLPQIIAETRQSGIDAGLTTNGTLGNEELWRQLLPNLTWVKFSVDAGTPDVYAKVHGVNPGLFDKTVESIHQAVMVKKKSALAVTLGVQFLVIEENLNDVEDAVKRFADQGLDYFVLKPYSLHPQMHNRRDTVYSEDTIQQLNQIVAEYSDKTNMALIFREGAMRSYRQGTIPYRHCRALPFWGHISAKGDFYTCSVFIGDDRFRAGNIHHDNMRNIFWGEKRRTSLSYAATTLKMAGECRLNCRMARINEFLEFLENAPDHVNFI